MAPTHRLPRTTTAIQRGSGGFTLIEMIISIVLLGLLATVGSSMISDSFTTSHVVDAGQASSNKARYTLERLAREIREVKYASSKTSPATYCDTANTITDRYCITTTGWTASHLQFVRTIGGTDVTVTIDYSNPNLTLGYTYSSHPPADVSANLSSQATSFSLNYLDATNTATTDVSSGASGIRFVQINLTVTDGTSQQSILQRTRIALRNS